ncbi:MAG: hypothetical protein EOP85_11425 [Verrucomicrobiaceae bacterium]|nr:MAG: hypothetical protein EOP85_11425 [Verrucomicrobiaceae bacterium]
MSGDNPYAPPQVDETEAPLLRHWRVEGTSVLVKNLAALPMVDLNTGDHDVPLKCVRRMVQQNNLSQSIRTVAVIFAFTIIGSKFLHDRFYAFLLMFVVLLLLRLFDSIRASSTSSLMVMEYLGKSHYGRGRE